MEDEIEVEEWEHGDNITFNRKNIINGKDKKSPYEHGYFHLTGGFNPTNNPINIDSVTFEWLDKIMTYNERYFEWFEYINMLLNFLHINGITKIKFFCMNNNFSKKVFNTSKFQ